MQIAATIAERGLKIAVVGVPKTIDNDIPFIDQSFGFQTAFAYASDAIRAAQVEATSTANGIGLVKLMGRHSGFIACYAALARQRCRRRADPGGPVRPGRRARAAGLPAPPGRRARVGGGRRRPRAPGQDLLGEHDDGARDASGNARLQDIGPFLRRRIGDHFAEAGIETSIRYIDPSYAIRSVPANPYDSVYCVRLAQAAVHAAMSGRTEMVVGRYRRRFVHIPMPPR